MQPNRSFLLIALFTSSIAFTQTEDAAPPVPMATALKLGIEGLMEKHTDPSEAGQDAAAQLFAKAKQIETESALAKRDLNLVFILDEWRTLISDCRMGPPVLEGILMEGGTMYSHAVARDAADVEVFLAGMAKRLPLATGEGDKDSGAAVKKAIKELKELKMEPDADAEAKKSLAEEIERQVENWNILAAQLETVPAEEAKLLSTFVLKSMQWVRGEEEEK
jgi:hypothetical protein